MDMLLVPVRASVDGCGAVPPPGQVPAGRLRMGWLLERSLGPVGHEAVSGFMGLIWRFAIRGLCARVPPRRGRVMDRLLVAVRVSSDNAAVPPAGQVPGGRLRMGNLLAGSLGRVGHGTVSGFMGWISQISDSGSLRGCAVVARARDGEAVGRQTSKLGWMRDRAVTGTSARWQAPHAAFVGALGWTGWAGSCVGVHGVDSGIRDSGVLRGRVGAARAHDGQAAGRCAGQLGRVRRRPRLHGVCGSVCPGGLGRGTVSGFMGWIRRFVIRGLCAEASVRRRGTMDRLSAARPSSSAECTTAPGCMGSLSERSPGRVGQGSCLGVHGVDSEICNSVVLRGSVGAARSRNGQAAGRCPAGSDGCAAVPPPGQVPGGRFRMGWLLERSLGPVGHGAVSGFMG